MDDDLKEFTAARSKRLKDADAELRPLVEAALKKYNEDGWDSLADAAAVLWLEMFESAAPKAYQDAALARFRAELKKALAQTAKPDEPPTDAQIDRVTHWVSSYTTNNATYQGAFAAGQRQKQWVSMHDEKVRHTHSVVDGQKVSIGGTFDVGGYKLHYPGQPVGPAEIWINCRCLVRGVGKAITMSAEVATFADEATDELPPDMEEGDVLVDEEVTPIPFHGVLAPVGLPSGDGRMFAEGGVSWRNLPLPMAYQTMTGEGGHVNSVTVGTIQTIELDENGLLQYTGFFNSNPIVQTEIIPGLADGSIRGVSVDVDMATIDLEASTREDDVEAFLSGNILTVFATARIAGATIVSIPAFQEAYIGLGECDCPDEGAEIHNENGPIEDDFPDEEEGDGIHGIAASATFAPGTHDGPGWITNPRATERIRRYWTHGKGAAKIKWGIPGDFNRCRRQLAKYVQNPEWLAGLCANMHKEAIGVWPGQEDGGKRKHAIDAIVASGGKAAPAVRFVRQPDVLPAEWFEDPKFDKITPLNITPEGRVFGHLAQWGVCHIGLDGVCSTPPSSPTNYAYFHSGYVETEQGDIPVGHLLGGLGHAPVRSGYDAQMATRHYDRPESIWADVAIGEDAHGIWFAGALREDVTEKQRKELKATGALSGDWRRFGGGFDLVAAISVATPGYPIPKTMFSVANGHQDALVASGIVQQGTTTPTPLDLATQLGIVAAAADEVEHRQARRAKLAMARQKEASVLRPARLAAIKKRR
jgi:hypothetical protein